MIADAFGGIRFSLQDDVYNPDGKIETIRDIWARLRDYRRTYDELQEVREAIAVLKAKLFR